MNWEVQIFKRDIFFHLLSAREEHPPEVILFYPKSIDEHRCRATMELKFREEINELLPHHQNSSDLHLRHNTKSY